MVIRVKLILEQHEYSALMKAALSDLRNPADQARYIVRKELINLGLLLNQQDTYQTNVHMETLEERTE